MKHKGRNKFRWHNFCKAVELGCGDKNPLRVQIQHEVIETVRCFLEDELKKYDHLHKEDIYICDKHIHVCAYRLLRPNDRHWQKSQCRKWLEKNHVRFPDQSELPEGFRLDPCDYCTKMTTIVFADDDDVMFAERNHPLETISMEGYK